MRLFIALPAPEGARRALEDAQKALRRQGARGRFTPPENLHMTLTFLGSVKDPVPVIEAMRGIDPARTKLVFDRLTTFGSVLVALFRPDDAAEQYVHALRAALDEAGIKYDRKSFRPHVTLCRDASFPPSLRFDSIENTLRGVGIPAEKVQLTSSDLSGETPRYTVIYTQTDDLIFGSG